MRLVATGARGVLGGYLAVHGAQKLFGSFGGPGVNTVAEGFEHIGLRPGREMATLAGAAELGGGVLTATGIAHPLGPVTVAATMAVAATTHRAAGPLASNGGYELALTDLAFAALVAADAGGYRLGPVLPKPVARLVTVLATVTAAALAVRMATAEVGAVDDNADDSEVAS